VVLCYITDRRQFPGDEHTRRVQLLQKVCEAVRCGIDIIQLREKDLSARDLETLACAVTIELRRSRAEHCQVSRLLINSRCDVAIACGADGVHLRSEDIDPAEVREIWGSSASGTSQNPFISVSCHSVADVKAAASGADLAVFGAVFGKRDYPSLPQGLQTLAAACRENIPVLAVGGVTLENARACMEAGASGIAAIRLFQHNNICEVVEALRASAQQ